LRALQDSDEDKAMTVTPADKVAGHFPMEQGCLNVERRSDGEWYDADENSRITAFEIAPMEEKYVEMKFAGEPLPLEAQTTILTMIEDEEGRDFIPAPGECERVGIPVKRIGH